MELPEVFSSLRHEVATDARGVPAAYLRAMRALADHCAHCGQRATIVNGAGTGTCARHHQVDRDGRRRLEEARASIAAAKARG
jgi:hypothetical protein